MASVADLLCEQDEEELTLDDVMSVEERIVIQQTVAAMIARQGPILLSGLYGYAVEFWFRECRNLAGG